MLKGVLLALPVFILSMTGDAHAQTSLGGMIGNVINSFGGSRSILTTIAYLAGLFLAVNAMFWFRDHVDRPNQVPLSGGVKRIIAGGAFLALPGAVEATINLLSSGLVASTRTSRHAAVIAATPTTLDEVVVKIVADISGPVSVLLSLFCMIAGLAFLLVAISRLTKTAQQGPMGPTGMGTIMTFVAASALLSMSRMVGAFSGTLFGDEKISTYAVLSPNINTALGTGAGQVISTIEALMTFIMIVGYIAFIRSWFVLKAYADHPQPGTLAQGLTFLFGGALAINLGDLVNAISTTLGYTGAGGFGVAFN